jgi:hypothetical protein
VKEAANVDSMTLIVRLTFLEPALLPAVRLTL